MGLEVNTGKLTFVNIKEGKFYIKPKGEEKQFFDSLSGSITKIDFVDEEYNGSKFEMAKFSIVDGGDRYLLQVRTDSGYFRGLCNSLKTGKPTEPIRISAGYKENNGKPQTTCFIEQHGQTLKHAFTKDKPGDYPILEQITFKGQTQWDGTKQIEYWKNWLKNITWTHEAVAPEIKKELPPHPLVAETFNDDLPF